MASRPIWSGMLRLSLVSVPVKAFTAMVTEKGEIHLNQLHDKCHSRIRYQKMCPVHGEVTADQIVMGYQYEKDKYVVIDQSERESARTKSDKSIEIDTFVPLDSVDPMLFQGRNYYLLPDGAGSQKPYALMVQAMDDAERCAVAQVALSGRDQVVVVRPSKGMLVMCTLNYESQMKDRAEFKDGIPDAKPKADELKLAKMLLENTFSDELDLSEYKDTYSDKLREIVDAKVAGHEIIRPPDQEAPPSFNLMDALRKSVAKSKDVKPTKKVAESAKRLTPPKRRRKSS
jgi:DNA end-binding protein Ku